MKNVKLFEEFSELNEGTFSEELEVAHTTISILKALMDGGFIDGRGYAKKPYEEANKIIKKDFGKDEFFDSDNGVKTWVMNAMSDVREFAGKHV